MTPRIADPTLAARICTAEEAAALIHDGDRVAMSGFTGAGHPKAVPAALARRATEQAEAGGRTPRIEMWTGAGTVAAVDGALAAAGLISRRLPYQSDPTLRAAINAGEVDYLDLHIGQVAPLARHGALGEVSVALIEAAAITADGDLVPTTSVGNSQTWLDLADRVIVEVNSWHASALHGLHDIAADTGASVPIRAAGDRIGAPVLTCSPDKVVAVVPTDAAEGNDAFTAPDAASHRIAGHLLDFLAAEVRARRLPASLRPLQSGVGNVANAVLAALADSGFTDLSAYTEVISDGMLSLIDSGRMRVASATSLALSTDGMSRFRAGDYRDRIVLRPAEISNHPEVVRRLGVIALNSMIEADIYGNINSSHIVGSRIMNGVGGSGDFARNGFLSVFITPSVAKGGAVSAIVPMASHVDHPGQDVDVIVTEHGLADLRGLAPRQRAARIIACCAHPDYRGALDDYFQRALRDGPGRHTPHLLGEALSWHSRYVSEGSMRGSAQ
ncbi:succinate CoA transferase [Mycobacterium koreense]|uniref:Propionyl-CoA--succinate CoA transferase n=1 Tax=Mycolicibacillus koreensis TaxID=1069220 RepID=A0A7I7SCZ4_9MYCO|nr:succinate CoA transferase [Mycolicibacillus koreensis]MCV7249853.1 succinate CoA transferase [Mycolicibacillus koreensis]OSC34922.1 propionyl-CoA--succinate CoA transferase [Mycolicibacillus koreensis]BBY54792.1 acetyl-CoA hydrolase [Mycolicibacillus koreensis]